MSKCFHLKTNSKEVNKDFEFTFVLVLADAKTCNSFKAC